MTDIVRTPAEHAAIEEGIRRHYLDTGQTPPNPLDYPPKNFGQVVVWIGSIDNFDPTPEQIAAARRLPVTTTLRDVLRNVGATEAMIRQAEEDPAF